MPGSWQNRNWVPAADDPAFDGFCEAIEAPVYQTAPLVVARLRKVKCRSRSSSLYSIRSSSTMRRQSETYVSLSSCDPARGVFELTLHPVEPPLVVLTLGRERNSPLLPPNAKMVSRQCFGSTDRSVYTNVALSATWRQRAFRYCILLRKSTPFLFL